MLALPLSRLAIGQTLVYQTGRIGTYGLLGLFFGLLGKGIALAGFQQALSIAAGFVLLGSAFFAFEWERSAQQVPGVRQLTRWVQKHIALLLQRYPNRAALGVGMLNGLLPCGLVYAAIAGAIGTGSAWQGGAFMALFGLGTLPLLLILMTSGQRFSPAWRQKFRLLQPLLLAAAGMLLLSRGFHLDLSLFESAVPPANPDCH